MVIMVWIASLIVITLGVARELVIALLGIDTPLKDLRHFALDAEHSVPVWYSSALMLAAATLLWLISRNDVTEFRRRFSLWNVLAIIFVLMSVDETSSFHEVLIAPLRTGLDLSGVFYFAWVLVAIPLLALLGFYVLPDLFALPLEWTVKFMASGIVYVGGAVGMELVGGYLASTAGWDSAAYVMAATIEESCEIIGLSMFVTYLLGYLVDRVPDNAVRFTL